MGDVDEAIARDCELVGLLHAACQHNHQNVPRGEAVHRIDGTCQLRQKLSRGATEDIDPKHVVARREGLGRYRFAAGADEPRLRGQGIRGDRASQTQGLQHT